MAKKQKLVMSCTEEELREIQRTMGLLKSGNLATAIYNSCQIVNDLYDQQLDGWSVVLHKPGYEIRVFKMPR